MGCEVMCRWSLSGLVGVFLDLVIAFFLLCASAMAYIASKFLGFFGMCLPCPCNGLFGVTSPNGNYCLQRMLINFPAQKVSNAQLSIKNKFPFNDVNGRLVEERKMVGEGSCNSVSYARKYRYVGSVREELSGRSDNGVVREGSFDVKGKGVTNQRLRGEVHRRRQGGVDYDIVSSVSSYDPPGDYGVDGHLSHSSSINKGGYEMVEEDRMVDLDYGIDVRDSYYEHASRITGSVQQDKIQVDEFHEDNEKEINNLSSTEVLKGNVPREIDLEQSLKEERAACAALYLELEKERNAAATAADEAMAMILRLQEEKAFFEMEARQYQRFIEEKSAYDADEMDILKEILVKREMEKLFLEKEVEAYRRMINLANEQLSDDGEDISDDPEVMLHQLSVAINKRAARKDTSNIEDQKFQEKEVVSVGGGGGGGGDHPYVPPQRDIERSDSSIAARLPPIGPRTKSLGSPLDNERLKIDNEVEWLQERLKIVQEGREKLKPSMEHREMDKLQLRLLEDISRQLQEMKPLMEPGKTIRHASLPTPSTEVTQLERRSRSVSSGHQKSS